MASLHLLCVAVWSGSVVRDCPNQMPRYSEHLTAELVLTDVSRAQCSEVVC